MSKKKRLLLLILATTGMLGLYLLFWPVPISPAAWTPSTTPELTGQYQQNSRLANTERLSLGTGYAPEDVAIDAENRIYAGLDDGRVMRLQPDGTRPELFADTHGRPLGMKFDMNGNLIVADAVKGLLSVGKDAVVNVLSTEADGVPFRCTNDLDIAADGTIYFTDASNKFPLTVYKADIVEHQPNGRLLAYDPKTKATQVILSHLCFANGVAVSPDQSFVLVVETGKYRVHRVRRNAGSVKKTLVEARESPVGTKYGESEIFIDNLPGFPDGISSNGKDKFWLALVAPRDAMFDKLLPHPFLRKAILRLPAFLQPAPQHYSFVLALDSSARVVQNLQDGSKRCYAEIANVIEHGGFLYFGSIGESAVGRIAL